MKIDSKKKVSKALLVKTVKSNRLGGKNMCYNKA